MLRIITSIFLFLIISCSEKHQKAPINQTIAIVVHGGAGTILKKNMSDEKEKNINPNWKKPYVRDIKFYIMAVQA